MSVGLLGRSTSWLIQNLIEDLVSDLPSPFLKVTFIIDALALCDYAGSISTTWRSWCTSGGWLLSYLLTCYLILLHIKELPILSLFPELFLLRFLDGVSDLR